MTAKPKDFWKDMDFKCETCNIQFKPDLQKDEPGHRVQEVTIRFFPPRGESRKPWSPISESSTAYAECPDCGKKTNHLVEPIKKTTY